MHYNLEYGDTTENIHSGRFNFEFLHGFLYSFSIIIFSEIGDKTFIIAIVMSMKHSRATVFFGSFMALLLMTYFAAFFCLLVPAVPELVTRCVSVVVFGLFGLRMLSEGCRMEQGKGTFEEVEVEIRRRETIKAAKYLEEGLTEDGVSVVSRPAKLLLEVFVMTVLGELGDRSQVSTLILATREDFAGVTLGAVAGHGFCTGLAVLGGRLIASRISVRTVTISGGVVFVLFALYYAFFDNAFD